MLAIAMFRKQLCARSCVVGAGLARSRTRTEPGRPKPIGRCAEHTGGLHCCRRYVNARKGFRHRVEGASASDAHNAGLMQLGRVVQAPCTPVPVGSSQVPSTADSDIPARRHLCRARVHMPLCLCHSLHVCTQVPCTG